MIKRAFSIILCFAIVLSVFQMTVLAEETEEKPIASEEQDMTSETEDNIEDEEEAAFEENDPIAEDSEEEYFEEESFVEESFVEEDSEKEKENAEVDEESEKTEEPEESVETKTEEETEESEAPIEIQEYTGELDCSGYCGDKVQWQIFFDGTLRIFGSGSTWDFDDWWYLNDEIDVEYPITHIIIEEGVTYIGEYLFEDMDDLQSIHIPKSVKEIGAYAFDDYSDLSSVYYSGSYIQWKQVVIGKGNTKLSNASVYPETLSKISDAVIYVPRRSYTYTGDEICPEVKVYFDKNKKIKAVEGVDYTVSYDNNTDIGIGSIIITGIGGFEGQTEISFEIFDYTVSIKDECVVECKTTSYTYNGKQRKPAVSVSYNGTALVEGEDYKLTYANNTDAGKGSWTVTGLGRYYGTATGKFTIAKATNKITTTKSSWSVNAKATKTQTIKLGAKATAGSLAYESSNSKVNVSKAGVVTIPKDFSGKVTIYITAKNVKNYKDITKEVTITVKKVAATKITLKKSAKVTVGFKKTLKPKLVYNSQTLTGMKWSSSNKKVATVNSKGVVTGKKPGKATITCKLANGKKYKCTVTVRKNKYVNMKYSKVESLGSNEYYGYVYVYLLDAHYEGKNLVLNLGLYNNRIFHADKFSWIEIDVSYNGDYIKAKKFKNVPINLGAYKKKKITLTIPMSKVYDLGAADDVDIWYDYYYYYSY